MKFTKTILLSIVVSIGLMGCYASRGGEEFPRLCSKSDRLCE